MKKPKPDFQTHDAKIAKMIRVNHAGEYGAKRIYEGQLKFTKDPNERRLITEMLQQEKVHLEYFSKELIKRRVRPTLLLPFWNITGYLIGACSAIAGIKTSMLLTQKVEEVIEDHYQQQIDNLKKDDKEQELLEKIVQFQNEEIAHKDIALKNNSQDAACANILGTIITKMCKTAIYISKKL